MVVSYLKSIYFKNKLKLHGNPECTQFFSPLTNGNNAFFEWFLSLYLI